MNNQEKELTVLKKRLHTYKTSKGSLIGVPDDLIVSVVQAWQQWPGGVKGFHSALGIKREQVGFIIKKGKKIFKNHKDLVGPFRPVEVNQSHTNSHQTPIILTLGKGKHIKFFNVDQLIEFINKSPKLA